MLRLRLTLISASMMIALGVLTINSIAQPPGRGGGGGRGGFGGGPGGFGGGPGGFGGGPGGGSLLGVALIPAVQEELKLKEPQKVKLTALNEKSKSARDQANQARQKLMQEAGIQWGGPGGPGGPGQNNGNNQNQNGGRGRRGQQNAQGGNDQAAGGQGGQGAQGGQGGRGGRGNRPQFTEEQQAAMQEIMSNVQAEMERINTTTETTLAKILDKAQYNRLKQVKLQLDGPTALLRDDMVEKLNISEEQVEQIRTLMTERRDLQRDARKAQGEIFQAFRDANPQPEQDQAQAQNGNNGNQRRGPRFDPEQMKKFMEQPDVKAKMDEVRDKESSIEKQFAASVIKVLYPRQQKAYEKMLGDPFDRSKIGGPAGWGFPGGRNRNQDATKKGTGANTAAAAKPATDDSDTPPTAATTTAPAKAKRKSLRELRGASPSSPE